MNRNTKNNNNKAISQTLVLDTSKEFFFFNCACVYTHPRIKVVQLILFLIILKLIIYDVILLYFWRINACFLTYWYWFQCYVHEYERHLSHLWKDSSTVATTISNFILHPQNFLFLLKSKKERNFFFHKIQFSYLCTNYNNCLPN